MVILRGTQPTPRTAGILAMAMGGGGGGGVPEQEDSVLFRRGAGQVRARPALLPEGAQGGLPAPIAGPCAASPAAGQDPAGPFTAGLWSA